MLGAEGNALKFVQFKEGANPKRKITPDEHFSKLEIEDLKKVRLLHSVLTQVARFIGNQNSIGRIL